MGRIILSAILTFFLSAFQSRGQELAVSLNYIESIWCGQPTGSMEAIVTGGTPPYTYTWYQGMGMPGGWMLMAQTGPIVDGVDQLMAKVVVTDALGAEVWEEGGLAYYSGPQIGSFGALPWCGEGPWVLQVSVSEGNYGTAGVIPNFGIGVLASNHNPPYHTFLMDPSVGTVEIMADVMMPVVGGCAHVVYFDSPIPTTILPEPVVVEVNGSCSNAPTGSFTVAMSGGSGINLRLKNANGYYVAGHLDHWVLPPAAHTFNNLSAGTYWMLVTGESSNVNTAGFDYACKDSIQVTIPSLGATCGRVQGTAFVDHNLNCTKQSNEPGIPNATIEILPGPFYVSTNNAGFFSLPLPNGSYTLTLQSENFEEHCANAPIPFTITGAPGAVTVNLPAVSLLPLDVRLSLGSGPARPGFEYRIGASVSNLTPAITGTMTVTMELDPVLEYVNAVPTPASVAGNTLTWTLSSLYSWGHISFVVHTMVPADVSLLGTDLVTTATVVTANVDANPDNNTATHTSTITGAYDPNDKLAWTSSGSTAYYQPAVDDWIDYTIRFQNTGTDTAFNVIITDTLLSTLDPGSIQIGAGSHPFTWQLRDQGTLKFYFLNILLPDSNVNEARSHGFVSFRIKARDAQDLQPGDELVNVANIYFDFNPPVITDPSVLVVPVPQVQVAAKVLLGGPYNSGNGMMNDQLRAQGLLPLSEPYSAMGHISGGGGGGSAAPSVFTTTGPNAIVDWVVVQLRSSTQNVVASKAALLQRDGDVVDVDGSSPVRFDVPAGNYHIAVLHRNHLGVVTAAPIQLTSGTGTVDLTSPSLVTSGINSRYQIGGNMLLWPGDVNADGVVMYAGQNNDRDPVLLAIGGDVPTNTVTGIYATHDVNMDGVIKYTGDANDRDVILQTIGGVVPTAVRVGQLP